MRCPLPTVKRRVGVGEEETESRMAKDARQKVETNRPAISGRVVGGGGCVEYSSPMVSRVSKVAKMCNRLDGWILKRQSVWALA